MRILHARTQLWALALVACTAGPGWSQEETEDVQALQRAAVLEARGRYGEARRTLEEVLRRTPASSAALFSLERVLRPLGESAAVLPWADRHLEARPRSSGARYLKLRVLSEIDSISGLQPAVEAWIAAEPGSPEPYREGARLLEQRVGATQALDLLARGRAGLGSPSALALETGDLLFRAGAEEAAGREWARAVGPEAAGAPDVVRRVAGLGGAGGGRAVESLLDALDEDPTSALRRRVGARIALGVGREARAREMAAKVAAELDGVDLKGFLTEISRAGQDADAPSLSLWALRALRGETTSERERRAVDRRLAASALLAGDTATALDARLRVVRSLAPRSSERRRGLADLIRVEAASSQVGAQTLLDHLSGFRGEFPDAPELDVLASAVAEGLRKRGREGEAVRVLQDVRGPRSSLERAFLLLEEGSVKEGREALLTAAPGLRPGRATSVIRLAAVLEGLSPSGAALVARAAASAHRGRLDEALAQLEGGVVGLGVDDRPAVLAHAARMASDGGRPAAAAQLRRRLIEGYPEAPEVPAATLALARWLGGQASAVDEAARLLEDLILRRPDAAVVPAARRELARLRAGPSPGAARAVPEGSR